MFFLKVLRDFRILNLHCFKELLIESFHPQVLNRHCEDPAKAGDEAISHAGTLRSMRLLRALRCPRNDD